MAYIKLKQLDSSNVLITFRYWCENLKMKIILGGVLLTILIIIIVVIVLEVKKSDTSDSAQPTNPALTQQSS